MPLRTRHVLAGLIAQLVSGVAGSASAEPSSVKLKVRGYRGIKTARLYVRRIEGHYTFLCLAPCTARVAPGSELRATIGGNTSEPHTFTVPDDGRTELDIEVSPTRDRAPVIAGISLTASGGLTVLVGLFWLALTQCNEQAGLYSGSKTICLGGRANKAQNALIGGSIAVAGVTAVTAGVLLLALRSREPHVVVGPTDDAPQSYGRKETVLGDVASMTSREPATSVGAAFTPLSYGFTF